MICQEDISAYRGPAVLRGPAHLFLLPHPLLRSCIAAYTITCPAGMPGEQAVLPTASTTLVYSLGERGVLSGLRGVNTRPAIIGGYAAAFSLMLLVEFHPGGLYPFLPIPQQELRDVSFPFGELSGELDRQILTAFEQAVDISTLIAALDSIFLSRLDSAASNAAVLQTMGTVLATRGTTGSRELSRQAFYSEKQLNRLFRKHVGTGVKTFSRIVRVNGVLRQLVVPGSSLERVAESGGYYDLSHLVRDLKELCGITPGEYLGRMSLFYSDPFKLQR